MAAIEDFLADCGRRMDKSIESTRTEFNSVRTGRASTALLDRITLDYYGTPTPLNNMATIGAPEARLLTVQPYDPTQIKAIEKAIMESDLGLTPSNDGKIVRLPIPQLTEERRKELVKVVRRYAEEGKVAVRNVRRDVMRHLEELVRKGEVGDDEERRAESAGTEADRRPREAHRRAPEAQGSRDPGGLSLLRGLERPGEQTSVPVIRAGSRGEIPEVVAIIMDGNGRWAEARGLPVEAGHREGTRALRRTVEAAIDAGVGSLAVYAFSTENWARPADEVETLLVLLDETIDREFSDLAKQGVRTRFIGRRDRVPEPLREKMASLEARTAANERLDLWVAFDYGGRAELVEAARRLVADGVAPDAVDERALATRLAAPGLPDVDLLVRTSGEQRISNFLLWGAAYAELVFTETLWPDFGEADLLAAIDEFARRQRRFGARSRQ